MSMEHLIEALRIFLKYKNEQFPTHCGHDWLGIMGITEDEVSADDKARLKELHFRFNSEYDCWGSSFFGSA